MPFRTPLLSFAADALPRSERILLPTHRRTRSMDMAVSLFPGRSIHTCTSARWARSTMRRLRNILNCWTRIAAGPRQGGRVILDLWNPEFFRPHPGEHSLKTAAGEVRETKRVKGDRLFVRLNYPDGGEDQFEWQLFTPATIAALGESVGLRQMFWCSNFDAKACDWQASPRR